jgi:hypothetical protein
MYGITEECFPTTLYVTSTKSNLSRANPNQPDVWSMAEMCTAIMVSSLPSLRPLLQKSRRFIISSSPSGSGDKRSSTRACKGKPGNNPPTIGSGNPQYKNDDASDVELIHVCMKPSEKPQIEEREVAMNQDHNTTMKFQQPNPKVRPPGDWV